MNKICVLPLVLLSACSQMEEKMTKSTAPTVVENSVGPNGELISPPNCPDWSASPYNTFENDKQGNIGCATVTNLGLMLEDPRDLVQGASGGKVVPDPQRSSDAIKNYRNGLSSSTGAATTTTPFTTGTSTDAGQ